MNPLKNKTKDQLMKKIEALQKRVNELQKSEPKSNQTLKDSDIEYRTMVENVMDGIYIINLKGFEYVNPAFEQILGYKAKEIYNKDFKFSNIIHPDDRKLITERSKAREKGKKLPSNYSFKAITKDGKTKHIEVNTIPLPGEKLRILGIMRDITDIKKAEEALKESGRKFRNYIESSGDIMYVVDDDLKFLYGNRKYLERRGLTLKELLGKEYENFHSDEGTGNFMERVKAVRESGKPIFYEYQSGLDGRYFLRTLSPIIDSETKEPESITVISRDITDRKKVEAELKESENKYKNLSKELELIFDHLPAFIFYKDKKNNFIRVNKNLADGFKMGKREMEGKSLFDMLPKDQAQKYWEDDLEVIKSGEPEINIEEPWETEEGLRWVSTNKIPLSDEKGDIIGVIGMSVDITEHKKAEEKIKEISKLEKKRLKELKASYEQLQKSQEASLNLMEDLSVEIEQHKQAENMLRISEKRYRSLFENIQNGFALLEMVFDKKGKPADFIFLEVNEVFQLQTGLRKKDIIGKKATDVMPGIENDSVNWIQRYGEVILTGKDISFENYSEYLKKWYSIAAYKPQENQIASVFTDITDRKKSELKIRQSRKQLRRLAAHLEDVREEERTIIARNIHDELGQLATALKMDVSWLQKQLPQENEQWISKAQTISDLVDMTSGEIQRICSELRPGVLDDLGLEDALEWYVSEYNKRTGTVCKLSIEYDLARLNKYLSVAVYRMIQEALTNVRRHAKASKVKISITGENGKLKLMIKDNGIGIMQEKIDDSTSFGLLGIEERALSLDGYSRISGKEGEGTTLMIVLGIGK